MFYDQFIALCNERGEKPYPALRNIGAKNTHVIEQWKKGSVPRQPLLGQIAEYFGVSIDYLLTGKETAPTHSEPELSEDEAILLSAYRALPEAEKRSVLMLLQRAAGQEPSSRASAE